MSKKVLLLVLTYNAERFIEGVLDRIPDSVWQSAAFTTELLIIDDQSGDNTFYRAISYSLNNKHLNITVLHNPANLGYGGNQKIGYHYAIQRDFDVVLLLHGDGQYPPEQIEQMVQPILDGEADAVLGSRMISKMDALRGHMPLYKWIGNQVLTSIQNRILSTSLAEFHTGFRAYSVPALQSIPFDLDSNYYDFDTDIIIQLVDTRKRIREIPIPTFYGEEISRVNGFRYAWLIVRSVIQSRLVKRGLFYHPRFDYAEKDDSQYQGKFGYPSSHEFALMHVREGSIVLDIGCGPGYMTRELVSRNAKVISVDRVINPSVRELSIGAIEADIESYDFDSDHHHVDTILLLDIIEHLEKPEVILRKIRERYSRDKPCVVITTANIGFISIRLGLLLGQFNYGKRGILDLDHSRLFTFSSLRQVLRDNGYTVLEEKGIPVPFPLAIGDNTLARTLCKVNQFMIRISKGLFSYQVAFTACPTPTLKHLLQDAHDSSGRMLDKWPGATDTSWLDRLSRNKSSPEVVSQPAHAHDEQEH